MFFRIAAFGLSLAACASGVSASSAGAAAQAIHGKTKVVVTDEMREEYTSDFVAFDSDRNNLLDAQEVSFI